MSQESAAPRELKGILPPLDRAEKAFNALSGHMLGFGSILVGLLAIPICLDIIFRFFFRISIDGMMEVELMTLVVIAYACICHTVVTRSPLQIDLLYQLLNPRWQIRLDVFAHLLCLAICAVLAWQGWREAASWTQRSAVLRFSESYFLAWIAFGFALTALAFLFQLRHSLREILSEKDYTGLLLALIAALALCILPFLYHMSGLRLSGMVVGGTGFCLLMILLLLRVPIGFAMALMGLLGLVALMRRPSIAFNTIGAIPFNNTAEFTFVALPMFMLMGELTFYSGLSRDLFDCANKWLGRVPGGLAVASVWGCAGFGAVCGDSLACVITMSSVALPAMLQKKYQPSLACGALASGGTMGILIPPSMGFIYYSILTEESIGKLFIAGILPGILLSLIFTLIIILWVKRSPDAAPPSENYPLRDKLVSTFYLLPVAGLFVLVVGGIMAGAFTPGEGGAVGAAGALLYALARRRLSRADLMRALLNTGAMTGRIFLLFAGVYILGAFFSASRLPGLLAESILTAGTNRYLVLALVILLYIFLGAVMNIIPMMMLTLPTIYPTIHGLGFDGVWFGVVTVILMEMGMITPPMGINVFTLSSLAPDIPMGKIFKGVMPFVLGMCLCIILLVLFPEIALILPDML